MTAKRPISFDAFSAGMTNQKLAVLGLLIEAKSMAVPIVLPALSEFNGTQSPQISRDFSTVFDLPYFIEALKTVGIEVTNDNKYCTFLDPSRCFSLGSARFSQEQSLGEMVDDSLFCRLLSSFRPVDAIRTKVRNVTEFLQIRSTSVGCQLRIERDWTRYIEKTLKPRLGFTEDYDLSYIGIIRKLHRFYGNSIESIYITCNEQDIDTKKSEINSNALEKFGYKLLWKSDAIPHEGRNIVSSLDNSLIDFEVCCSLAHYSGTSRSTFFNIAAATCYARGLERNFFLYNTLDNSIVIRRDNGACSNAMQARLGSIRSATKKTPTISGQDPQPSMTALQRAVETSRMSIELPSFSDFHPVSGEIGKRWNVTNGGAVYQVGSPNLLANSVVQISGEASALYLNERSRFDGTKFSISGRNCLVYIGERCRIKRGEIKVSGDDCCVIIGDRTTWESGSIICGKRYINIVIGFDCMLSNNIVIRTDDGHPIFERDTGSTINAPESINLEPHVWIGNAARVNKGVRAGTGSVLGEASIAMSDLDPNCIYAGVPATKVRENIAWSR